MVFLFLIFLSDELLEPASLPHPFLPNLLGYRSSSVQIQIFEHLSLYLWGRYFLTLGHLLYSINNCLCFYNFRHYALPILIMGGFYTKKSSTPHPSTRVLASLHYVPVLPPLLLPTLHIKYATY